MTAIKQKGFTLIELLVVLVIISIIATSAYIAAGDFGRSKAIQANIQQLQNLISLAKQKAILEQQFIGIRITNTGYGFMQNKTGKDNDWQVLADNILQAQTWPSGVTVILLNNDKLKQGPQIIISPEGQISHFELKFFDGNHLLKIVND